MADLGYDGKVAVITGAGGGLGRSHALELAQRGALVVVNDLGGSVDGKGGSHTAAQQVVDQLTVEDIRDHFDEIRDERGYTVPANLTDEMMLTLKALNG